MTSGTMTSCTTTSGAMTGAAMDRRALGHDASASSPLARGGTSLSRLADKLLNMLQRDRDRRALQRLDDRLLHDIGVSRSEVELEVNKPFWRG